MKSLNPKIEIYGVQAAGAPSMYESIKQKQAITLPQVSTVADGIAVKTPGDLTYDICSKYVDDICTVSEDEICAAILRLLEEEKIVAEGAGAVSVGGCYVQQVPIKARRPSVLSAAETSMLLFLTVLSTAVWRRAAVYAQYQWSLTTNPDSSMRSTALSQAWAAMCLAYIMSAAHTARRSMHVSLA